MASNKVVVTFACVAGTTTAIVAGSLLYRTLSRDRWEVFHAADCMKRLDDADRIKSSDPLAAYRIYEEVLSEAAQHELSDSTFQKRFTSAAKEKEALYVIVAPIIRQQEIDDKRLAEQKRLQAEAQQRRKDNEKRRRLEQEATEKRLASKVRERLRFYESRDGYIPRPGRHALDALKKLESHVQIEVTYDQYRDQVADTWAEVRIFIESEKGQAVSEFSALLRKAIGEYKAALESWRTKLATTSVARSLALEGSLQGSWKNASRAIQLCSDLLNEHTREVALRQWHSELDLQARPNPPPLAIVAFSAVDAREYQERWAKHLGRAAKESNSIGLDLVLIPPGEFAAGPPQTRLIAWSGNT